MQRYYRAEQNADVSAVQIGERIKTRRTFLTDPGHLREAIAVAVPMESDLIAVDSMHIEVRPCSLVDGTGVAERDRPGWVLTVSVTAGYQDVKQSAAL